MYAVHNERELPAARRSSLVDCKQQLLRGLGTGVTAALGGGQKFLQPRIPTLVSRK